MIYCKHIPGDFVRLVTVHGHYQLRRKCATCGEILGASISQKGLSEQELAQIPVHDTGQRNPPCALCGSEFTALHHTYPQSIARKNGVNPDEYPTVYLCRECHAKTHAEQTPGLLGSKWKG